jgi:hypothetical protein
MNLITTGRPLEKFLRGSHDSAFSIEVLEGDTVQWELLGLTATG